MKSETVPERGVRLLREEYERQQKLQGERQEGFIARVQALVDENPELAPVARRLVSQHFGWV